MLAHDFLKKDDRNFALTSQRSMCYFALLVVAKIVRCIGIFLVDLLAKQIHIIGLLCFLKFVTSCVLLPVQKPFSSGRSIRKSLHVRICQLAFFNSLIDILWFYGITFCGPLRSILVFEQNPSIILIAILSAIKGSGSASKTRGVICLIIGYVALFVMDYDSLSKSNHAENHKHQNGLNHIFYHVVGWFGLSDHKIGVLILLIALFMKMGYDSNFRHLAVEIGGPKRLYSMITVFSTIFLIPFTTLALALGSSNNYLSFNFVFLLVLASLTVLVIDFYAEAICFQHVADPVMAAARWSPIAMFSSSLFFSWIWYENLYTTHEHTISGGVVIVVICFCAASFTLTSQNSIRSKAGHFIGISDSGMPLYTHGEAFLQKTSKSILNFCKETLAEVLAESDSRRIFWFLCANLMFCFVEFIYGFLTNSLGLISDGFHMLFDCSALVMGLIASVMARWTSSHCYSYGYGRVEVFSGFINALFLIVIALFIFLEALQRLYNPPNVHTDKLMIVAVAGLFVNLFGMYAFHNTHNHSHGGNDSSEDDNKKHGNRYNEHGHSHNHSHSHSHSHSHGHSHGGNANMQGVFLHVLADTLGSVFVIISTLLIEYFGWQWVDPLCSLILSILILGSVYPLLKSSAAILLQSIPDEINNNIEQIKEDILHTDGVISYSNLHAWQLKSGYNVISIHIRVKNEANDQITRHKVQKTLKNYGFTQITIQIEKENFSYSPIKNIHGSHYNTSRM